MTNTRNKQVIANSIMKDNHARNVHQSTIVAAVALCATLLVGFTGFVA